MPRSNTHKYEPAYEAVLGLATRTGLEVKSISDVLIKAVNNNKIRMYGELLHLQGTREKEIRYPKSLSTGAMNAIPRNIKSLGLWVIPAYYSNNRVLYRSALSDQYSNIYLGPSGKYNFTSVIANAHLLTFDLNKVLRKAFSIVGSTASAGAKRNDSIWGEVILHLLELQDRNALSSIRTTDALVKSVLMKHPDFNSTTIRHVLAYVVAGLNQRRHTVQDSGGPAPAGD